MINPKPNVPLSGYSTMRLGGPAAYLSEIRNTAELQEAVTWASTQNLPVMMIGGGSNVIWPDAGYQGLVLVNKIMGYELQKEDEENAYLTVGAGEPWDSVVARSVLEGLTGIEHLSLIPGTTGATPIQNVGAYGRETSEVLVVVQAYDRETRQMVTIPNSECNFSYRSSRFKTTDKGRFFITSVTFHLTYGNPAPPFYPSLQAYLTKHNVTAYTPETIRDAVVAIRSSKLPDPAKVANCGSFFFNPSISKEDLQNLQFTYAEIPNWPRDDGTVKISAAWLIETAGFKDYHDEQTGMGTWPKQPLVFVNEHARSTADLVTFKQKVAGKVKELFGIDLVPEPELVG